MGTSTSHPSPRDRDWASVLRLYATGASPGETAGAIARCVGEPLVEKLTDPALCALQSIAAEAGGASPAEVARDAVARLDECSDIGWAVLDELARTAAIRAALLVRAGLAQAPADAFAAEYCAALFEHLVARDIADYLGTEAFPNVAAAAGFADAVAEEARLAVRSAAEDPSAAAWTAVDGATRVAALLALAIAALRARESRGG
jgi:hypothetical protein